MPLIAHNALTGKVALVTGASSGLGRATSLEFAGAGAQVGLVARTADELDMLRDQIEAAGGQAIPIPVDLADAGAAEIAVDRMMDAYRRLDVLVNAAGTDEPGPAVDLTVEDWDNVMAVNLRAPFLFAKAAFGHLRQTQGIIINISSVAGKRGWANATAYCASKFGLAGLTQALAAEGKTDGIRVCIVYPGAMDTHWGAWTTEDRRLQERRDLPTSVALPPEDVARLIAWIASCPSDMALNEVIVTPLQEQAWP